MTLAVTSHFCGSAFSSVEPGYRVGSPCAQVALDMDAFRPLGFRENSYGHWPWWQRWLVILRGGPGGLASAGCARAKTGVVVRPGQG